MVVDAVKKGKRLGVWLGWRVGVVVVYGLLWVLVLLGRARMPPEFPLFYSLPYSEEQLGVFSDVYRVMGWLGLLLVVSEALGWWLIKMKYRVLSVIMYVAVGWAVGLWGITILRVWMLVGW